MIRIKVRKTSDIYICSSAKWQYQKISSSFTEAIRRGNTQSNDQLPDFRNSFTEQTQSYKYFSSS